MCRSVSGSSEVFTDYIYTVTNTGLVAANDVRVADDRIDAVTGGRAVLAPASSTECRGRYCVALASAGLALIAAGLCTTIAARTWKARR